MFGVPLYVAAASGLVVMSLPLLIWSLAGRRRPVMSTADAAGVQTGDRAALLEVSTLDRVLLPFARFMGRQARRVTPAGWVESVDRKVRLAGSPPGWSVERILALKLVLAGAGGIGGFLLVDQPSLAGTGIAVLGAVVGYWLFDAVLAGRGRERQKLILRQLPDTLDQLTISVEAGLGFDAALQRVSAGRTGPIAEELARVLTEVKMGASRSEALKRLLDRTDVYELRHFVLAVQQAEQFGLPIARVLRIQSGELRVKRRQRAEEEAMKIPVKIVFPLVFCIFPALFVVLLGPAMIRVARTLL